ncbi:MAG: sigma-70 family RNA polymerase sigma factor, partial [Verrucomicrobiota bacterium]
MTDSQDLLAEYRRNGSDAAFRELIARYVDLVYSTALRLVEGDTHRAEDVAQTVFVDLARLVRTLSPEVRLGGWLHRHTCFVAANTLRGERRRQSRERQAVEMNALQNHSEADFSQVAPLLDEAINELGEADRTAILLRFFEQHDFRSVGEALGSNEDAARMRVTRALEKLEEFLKRRGVTASAASLGVVLTANAVQAAPVGLVVTISTAAAALAGTTATIATYTTMNWLNIKSIASIVVAAIAAGTGAHLVQQREANRLRSENQQLIAQLNQLTAERDTALSAASQNNDEVEQRRKDKNELLRLRGEVGVLRQQTLQLGKSREENQRLQTKQAGIDAQEQERQAAL